MPTTRPRYTITDTGETAKLLDLAAKAWPEVTDRRELLRLVLEAGGEKVRERALDEERRHALRLRAMRRGNDGLDVELLLSNAMWR